MFNEMCEKGEIDAVRMFYDSRESVYYVCNVADMLKGKPLKKNWSKRILSMNTTSFW
jgi:hypothetical protein